jgi:hypothetical protein
VKAITVATYPIVIVDVWTRVVCLIRTEKDITRLKLLRDAALKRKDRRVKVGSLLM